MFNMDTIVHDDKRVIVGRNGGRLTPFTPETARAAVRAREEKRIRLYNAGARRAVQDTQLIREYGEDAHIVERAMTLQQIATTPDAGKAAVLAAQALDVAQGLITKGKDSTDAAPQSAPPAILLLVAELERRGLADEVVDADADAGE